MSINKEVRLGARGFTVVELMIATAVFGVVLLLITVAILQFTRVYYKGVTQATTQDTARTIVDRLSQAIQFNGGAVTPSQATPAPDTPYAFCVGNQQYSYAIGAQMVDGTPSPTQNPHALVVKDAAGCTASSTPEDVRSSSVAGRELLAPKMRLARMQVQSVAGNPRLYKISVKVVYGDDDLLTNATNENAICKSQDGSQFCAVSDITTVVTKRVE